MAARRLNARQIEVLQWVSDGLPEGHWLQDVNYTHRSTARMLAGHGLLTVTGRGPSWTAEITESGQHYLDHGEYPPSHRLSDHRIEEARIGQEEREKRKRAERLTIDATKAENSHRRARNPPKGLDWFEVDSPRRLQSRNRAKSKPEQLPDPWEDRVLISVKEAAWLLSVSEHTIRQAVKDGDIQRVFIGGGTTNYRVVYDSLLAWVDAMPRSPRPDLYSTWRW